MQMHHRQFAVIRSVCIAFACALLAFAFAKQTAAETAPYQARVIAAGASVRSGPGENFYPTDTLAQGDVVEVYREKPGGWLAIRPPVGSFSWVAERDLIVKDGALAEVVKDDVASRIGSRLSDRRNAAQVRLKQGEGVEVLGEEMISGGKWYKIAPPAGEFRWVQASVVEKLGPIPAPSEVTQAAASAPVAASTTAAVSTPAATSTESSGPPPLLPNTKPPEPNTTTPPAALPQPANAPMPAPAAPGQTAAVPAVSNQAPPQELSQELATIELRLSRMAAAPTNLWNTERLERDTAQLMARAKTQAERDAVRVTQDKVNRFSEIGRRHNQVAASVAQPVQPGGAAGATGAAPADSRTAAATTANGGPYDAVGILRPVVSRRPGAPQFALVDERGQVVSFVTPTPDLNLQPYLGHRVGVVGNRGFIPEFQRSNVTAARVTPLNERIVR
jgi:hypothetical protein